jgi:hypothetical protein
MAGKRKATKRAAAKKSGAKPKPAKAKPAPAAEARREVHYTDLRKVTLASALKRLR